MQENFRVGGRTVGLVLAVDALVGGWREATNRAHAVLARCLGVHLEDAALTRCIPHHALAQFDQVQSCKANFYECQLFKNKQGKFYQIALDFREIFKVTLFRLATTTNYFLLFLNFESAHSLKPITMFAEKFMRSGMFRVCKFYTFSRVTLCKIRDRVCTKNHLLISISINVNEIMELGRINYFIFESNYF